MYNFTIPREKFDENNPDKQIIRHLIQQAVTSLAILCRISQRVTLQH